MPNSGLRSSRRFVNGGYTHLMIWGIWRCPATLIFGEFRRLAPLDVAREWGEGFWVDRELWEP